MRYERGDSVARAYRKSQSPVLDRKPRRDRSYDRAVSELTPTLGARDRPPPLPLIWSKLQPPVSRDLVSRRRLLDVDRPDEVNRLALAFLERHLRG
jgi:hypothetical protein